MLSSLIVFVPTTLLAILFRHTPAASTRRRLASKVSENDVAEMNLQSPLFLKTHRGWLLRMTSWTLPWWVNIILYVVAAVGSILCIYTTLLYAVTFNDDQAVAWISSFALSVVLSVFVWQTLKSLLGVLTATLFGGLAAGAVVGTQLFQLH